MFKKMLLVALLLVGISIITFGAITGDEYIIKIDQSMAQEQVNKKLPKLVESKGVSTLVKDADITFLADNRVQVRVDFEADGYGMDALGQAEFKSGIRYQNGNFFLDNLELIAIKIDPSQRAVETQSKIKKSLAGAWNKFKSKASDKDDEATHNALDHLKGKALEKGVPKLKSFAERKIKETVETTPVYSLNGKDFKQSMAALALKDIQFEKEQMTVTLSPLKMLGSLMLYLIGGIIVVLSGFGMLFVSTNGRCAGSLIGLFGGNFL